MAEGVFAKLLTARGYTEQIEVDSAGTTGYHAGEPPDSRAQLTARRYGIDISRQRARQVTAADFESFDFVIAMDRENLAILRRMCPNHLTHRLYLMCGFEETLQVCDVPDPYYSSAGGFEEVYDLIRRASQGLLATIEREYFAVRE